LATAVFLGDQLGSPLKARDLVISCWTSNTINTVDFFRIFDSCQSIEQQDWTKRCSMLGYKCKSWKKFHCGLAQSFSTL